MKTLYKYVKNPDRLLQEGYIRATQLSALNDPFEGNYDREGLEALNLELEYAHSIDIDLCNLVESGINTIGVVCLTESRDNLLMWSHYADEHRGCVVGFRVNSFVNEPFFDFFEHLEKLPVYFLNLPSPFDGSFQPVNYRKQPRYRIDSLEVDYSNFNNEQILYEIFQRKSDEWIYEKEHRAILKLEQADRIVIPFDIYNNEHVINIMKNLNCYQYKNDSHYFYMERIPNADTGFRSCLSKDLVKFSTNINSLYLFKISKGAVKSITYGFNSSLRPNDINTIFTSKHLEHWNTTLNKNYYTLEFQECD